jgi:hypothetical protein
MFDVIGHTFAQKTSVKISNYGQTLDLLKRLKWFSCAFSKFHYRSSKSANTKVVRYFREHILRNWRTFQF